MRNHLMTGILTLTMLVLISFISFAQAQPELPRITYQASLRNFAGELVPDSFYFMTFRYYSDSIGGTLLWSESHPQIPVRGGRFNADLGSVNPCSLDIYSAGPLYLETQIGDDALPLNRRIRVGSAPRAGSSQRVAGDIYTLPGSIRMFDPQPEPPGVDPLLEMRVAEGSSTFKMFDPQPEPPGYAPLIEMRTDATLGTIRMFDPQPEPPGINPLVELGVSQGQGSFKLFDPQPEPPGDDPLIEMRTGLLRASIRMFDPQPEPPGINPLLEINAASGMATIKMFDPQPEPPGYPSIELSSSGSARFFTAGTEYMGVEPSPFMVGGTLKMYGDAGTTIILSSSGRVGIGTGSTPNILTIQQYSSTDPIADAWTTYSSRRWKTNIHSLEGALDKVMRLNGVNFDWIENGKHDIGLIAEQVGQVVPEVVAYEDNGIDAKSVDYARLTALLIEAVKEQQKTIEQLKFDIKELKDKEVSK